MKKYFCILTLFSLTTAWSDPERIENTIMHAEHFLMQKNYAQSITLVQPLLDNLALGTLDHIIRSHKILGTSYCELGKNQKASNHFQTLLHFSKNESASQPLSKPCQLLFMKIRTPLFISKSKPAPIFQKKISPEDDSWKYFMPFGMGQFHAKQHAKAWTFLGVELISAATIISTSLLFKHQKNSDGSFSNASKASFYRNSNWAGIGLGSIALSAGLIDSIIHSKKRKKPLQKNETRLAYSTRL